MTVLFLALAIFYVLNAIYYMMGVRKAVRLNGKMHGTASLPSVSVIVPARNEESNLITCIDHLLMQDYPSELYEIILVNDRSSDQTSQIISGYAEKHPNVTAMNVVPSQTGSADKKGAIALGVEASRGDILMTTDADTRNNPDWVREMASSFEPGTGVVFGMTVFQGNGHPLDHYQALDTGTLNLVSAAMAANGTAVTCSGANMAFRRQAYEDANGYNGHLHIRAGTDDLLLQRIDKYTKWLIKPLVTPKSFVYTAPVDNLRGMINQRARWASTGIVYPKRWIRGYLVLLYLSLVAFVAAPFLVSWPVAAAIWGVKLIADLLMAKQITRTLQDKSLWRGFLSVFFGQPVIVTVAGLLGTLGKFTWK
ncbi:MAG: glycosyltransferase [Candidatus Marinimicrobia bacterium]|nr:glycosyltransferase [Candidatus Neomarinimicrobiota bacterium]MCF7829270.1 glycosyltransferase [Candidatus Neomarinimicrobiota bacterium]MCF7881077.1 glycosyltransferase [Candidatus Neomarinimicrobiota bacterium]